MPPQGRSDSTDCGRDLLPQLKLGTPKRLAKSCALDHSIRKRTPKTCVYPCPPPSPPPKSYVQIQHPQETFGAEITPRKKNLKKKPPKNPPEKRAGGVLRGGVLATVEMDGQKPLTGRIWLYARGALNFDDDKGETIKMPLAKISRVLFSAEPVPERPMPPPRPKPVRPATLRAFSPADSPATAANVEIISRGEEVDVQKHCESGKITIVDFYADWCGPCRSVGPVLEERVNKDDDLVLRKVNIVNWASPVARPRFDMGTVPEYRQNSN